MSRASRRRFLKQSGGAFVASTAYAQGLMGFLDLLIQNNVAHAQLEEYPYKYVNMMMTSAPPRWYFDQPLNPENNNFVAGSFGTELELSGGKWQAVYKHYRKNFGGVNVYLPPVWNLKSAYSNEAFDTLLKESLMIRGINMEINSHPLNRERTVRPFATNPSVTGLVADKSSTSIPSIGHAGASATTMFRSPKAAAVIEVSVTNPVAQIIQPFDTTKVKSYGDLKHTVKQALSRLDQYADSNGVGAKDGGRSLAGAYEMFDANLAEFTAHYGDLYKKYEAICKAEVLAEFPGVTTSLASIKPDGSAPYRYAPDRHFTSADNLSTIVKGANVPALAQAFALVEFCLTRNLTSSMTVNVGQQFSNVKGVSITHDQHNVGAITSVIFTSLYYRSYLGCMMELRKQLMAAGVYDKTVLHTTAEFSRTPKTDGSGSDHGFHSSSCLIVSGMIREGGLIGNVSRTNPSSYANYKGTWGYAAPFLKEGGVDRAILNDDVVNTICEMMQVQKIATKGVSLVTNRSGSVELTYKGAKNVA